MGDGGPVSVEQHLERVLTGVRPLAPTPVPLLDALGLVCADDVVSDLDLPRFDNSAMDGYAVRVADLSGVDDASPVELPVAGEIGAGQAGQTSVAGAGVGRSAPRPLREPVPLRGEGLPPGTALKIMTGAPVPTGADAVVPYEWTDRGVDRVRVERAPAPGQHVRTAGDDVRRGDRVLAAGTPLGPRQLGLLAATGHAHVTVRPRPRVVVISTGAELRDPGEPLAPDSIYDGNSYLLAAAAVRAGATARRLGIVGDDPEVFAKRLREEVADADLVVTSGGVSQGDYDVVKHALRELGSVWFGAVSMQPGKPQGFGAVDGVPICCLPGNPVSAFVSFELFVRPALRRMMGRAPAAPALQRATLAEGVRSPHGRRQYLRGRLEDGAVRTVTPVGGSGSHLVANLAVSDALIVVPQEATELSAGTEVSIVPLEEP